MKIIPYHEKFFLSFVTLIVTCFGVRNPRSEELIQWKFFETPHDSPITQCTIDHNQVVGQYSLIPLLVTQHGKMRHAFRSQDMCVSPAYRRQGLITKIATTAYDRITLPSLMLGFSNTLGVRVDTGSKKYGYTVVGQLTRTILFPTLFRITTYTLQEHTTSGEIEQLPFASFDYFQTYLSVHKDYGYIKRRYFDKPGSTYRFFSIIHEEKVIGRVVLRFHRGICSVLDFAIQKDHSPQQMFKAVQSIAFKNRCPIITYLSLPNTINSQLTKDLRTFSRKQPYYFTIKKHLQRDEADVLDRDQWWVMGGDVL